MDTTQPRSLRGELDRLESLRDPAQAGYRRFQRFVVRAEAELHPMNRDRLDPTPIEVQLRDISRGGVGLLAQQPLEDLSAWRICFLQEGYVIGEQAMIVRFCRPVSENLHLIGGQFVIDTGLLISLGISPGALEDEQLVGEDETREGEGDFVGPEEMG